MVVQIRSGKAQNTNTTQNHYWQLLPTKLPNAYWHTINVQQTVTWEVGKTITRDKVYLSEKLKCKVVLSWSNRKTEIYYWTLN